MGRISRPGIFSLFVLLFFFFILFSQWEIPVQKSILVLVAGMWRRILCGHQRHHRSFLLAELLITNKFRRKKQNSSFLVSSSTPKSPKLSCVGDTLLILSSSSSPAGFTPGSSGIQCGEVPRCGSVSLWFSGAPSILLCSGLQLQELSGLQEVTFGALQVGQVWLCLSHRSLTTQ